MKRHVGLLLAVTALGLAAWHEAQAQIDLTLERRVKVLETTVQELNAQVTQLRSAVRVDPGSVTITSSGTLRLQAAANLEATGALIKLNNGGRPLLTLSAPLSPGMTICMVPGQGGPCLVQTPLSSAVSTVFVP